MFRFLIRTLMASFIFSILVVLSVTSCLQQVYKQKEFSTAAKIPHTFQSIEKDMVIHFVNLKIGKITLIQMGREGILMDVGDIRDHQELVDYLDHEGVQSITHIFLTNWSKENMSGLVPLIKEFPEAQIYVPDATSASYELPADLTVQKLKAGDHLTFSDKYGISLDILTPLSPVFHDAYNDSLVTLLHYQKLKVLLTSDIREEAEQRVLQNYSQLKAEIMTVPDRPTGVLHSKNWIKAVNPQTAIMVESPCDNCEQVIKDAANSYSQEWSDFFFIPIGKNLKIIFSNGAYTTPKNELE